MYKRLIICDICKKEENLDDPYRKKWWIENILHVYCTKKCFMKSVKKGLNKLLRL